MKNTLQDLNNYLFETLERLTDDDATEEQMQREITRAEAVTRVAETVIHNGELALRTMQHLNRRRIVESGMIPVQGAQLPEMLPLSKVVVFDHTRVQDGRPMRRVYDAPND